KPVRPLPRLWKLESDSPAGEPASSEAEGRSRKDSEAAPVKPSSKSSKGNSTAQKSKAPADGKEKKVLLEDTPALDTYETRRRARFLIGGLGAVCVLLAGWIAYRVFIYDPSPIDIPFDASTVADTSPEPSRSLDQEARFMYNRAHELAKSKRTDLAIAMLN